MSADTSNPYESPLAGSEAAVDHGRPGNTAVITLDTMIRAHLIDRGERLAVFRLTRIGGGLLFLCLGIGFMMMEYIIISTVLMVVSMFFFVHGVLTSHLFCRNIEKQYRQSGKDRGLVMYESGPDDLRILAEESDTLIKWSDFREWKESDGLLLGYLSDKSFRVIPIGQLDAQMQQTIRENLAMHSVQA